MRLDYHAIRISGLLATLVVLHGCTGEQAGSEGAKQPNVGVVQPVERSIIEYAYFTGQIQATESVQLRARVTGYLTAIPYTPGTIVAKDTVLFEIDHLPYKAQVDIAKGKLAEAQSQVLEGKAKVAQAEARVALARTKVDIDKEVAKTSGAISKLSIEEDTAKLKESEATLVAMQATVTSLEASVKAAEANLESNELNLGWTKVRAPIAGRVDRNLLTVGNLVTADVTTLTNIIAAENVYVYFDVDEPMFLEVQKEVREGAYAREDKVPIGVALQNEQGYPHEGLVDLVANALNMGTGTIKVRGILKNADKALTAGNFVRARLAVDRARPKLVVPDRAVVLEQTDTFLLVVGSDGKVEKRKVTIGSLDPTDKTLRVIEKGVKPDEWVIVEGRQRVRPGMEVKAEHLTQPAKK
jgi:RND family efflux transporter MFP subunit